VAPVFDVFALLVVLVVAHGSLGREWLPESGPGAWPYVPDRPSANKTLV
jgi:hypothetical protein